VSACPRCAATLPPDLAYDPTVPAGAASSPAPRRRAASDPLIGREVIGQYVVREKLGEGGMGAVYLVDQPSVGRRAAIKVLRPELSRNRDIAGRFNLEARAVSRLSHPNIVTIYNHGAMDDGTLFLAMEYLEGRSLQQIVREDGALAPERATLIARQVAGALMEAHEHKIVHRDLKPSNVMIVSRADTPEFVKVLDFGMAKIEGVDLTTTGLVCGTPPYMSPEQFRGSTVDARSDLYSLGVVLFELLAGVPPFSTDSPIGYMNKHLNEAPPKMADVAPRARVPPALEALVRRLLAKEPADRPASIAELVTELDEALRPAPAAVSEAMPQIAVLPMRRASSSALVARSPPIGEGARVTMVRVGASMRAAWGELARLVTACARWVWTMTGARLRRRRTHRVRDAITAVFHNLRPGRRRTVRDRVRKMNENLSRWLRRVVRKRSGR